MNSPDTATASIQSMTYTAYIGLGSNLGDRRENIELALTHLNGVQRTRVSQVATVINSAPVDCPAASGDFLNTVAAVETELDPVPLLAELQQIERIMGRVRSGNANEPRTIDLDLLLHSAGVCDGERVVVPHPRMHLRRFVLEPLVEIAPQAWHPGCRKTAAELLRE